MIDLDKAAQAAEALGWRTNRGGRLLICGNEKLSVGIYDDGDLWINSMANLFVVSPLIAAWAALAAGGTDGY